jgi:hypothetical protein
VWWWHVVAIQENPNGRNVVLAGPGKTITRFQKQTTLKGLEE